MFLIEADTFRFNNNVVQVSKDIHYLNQTMRRLVGVFNGLIEGEEVPDRSCIEAVCRSCLDNHIPLQCLISNLCNVVWGVVTRKLRDIRYNTSFRKHIINDYKIELITVVNNKVYHYFYHKFLWRMSVHDSNCLSCWHVVKGVLGALQKYKLKDVSNTSGGNIKVRNSIFQRTAELSVSRGKVTYCYENIYEALSLLLQNIKSVSQYIHRHDNTCSGISHDSAMGYYAVVDEVASLAPDETESLDVKYANELISTIDILLSTMERDAFQYLQSTFDGFLASTEFLELVAFQRAAASVSTCGYLSRVHFLCDVSRVRLHWKDTGGVLYLPYLKELKASVRQPVQCCVCALRRGERESVSEGNTPLQKVFPNTGVYVCMYVCTCVCVCICVYVRFVTLYSAPARYTHRPAVQHSQVQRLGRQSRAVLQSHCEGPLDLELHRQVLHRQRWEDCRRNSGPCSGQHRAVWQHTDHL